MKKLLIGVFMLTAVGITASAQTTKNTHGKTVSTTAKTTTPGTNHGKVVSEVAKKDRTVTVKHPKKKTVKVHSNNRYKTKVEAVPPKENGKAKVKKS